MSEIKDLLDKAKTAIAEAVVSGESHYKDAAEYIAQAQEAGATQKQIGEQLGKSRAWLKFLLAWRADGYLGGPFEKSHKTRKASRASHSKRRKTRKADTRSDDSEGVTEREFEAGDEPEEFDTKTAKTHPQNWMTGILLRAEQSLQMCRDLEFLIAGALKVAKNKGATRTEIADACRAVATAWGTQAQKIEKVQHAKTDRESQKARGL